MKKRQKGYWKQAPVGSLTSVKLKRLRSPQKKSPPEAVSCFRGPGSPKIPADASPNSTIPIIKKVPPSISKQHLKPKTVFSFPVPEKNQTTCQLSRPRLIQIAKIFLRQR